MKYCDCEECRKSKYFCKKCGGSVIQKDNTFVCSDLLCEHGEYFVGEFCGLPDFVGTKFEFEVTDETDA